MQESSLVKMLICYASDPEAGAFLFRNMLASSLIKLINLTKETRDDVARWVEDASKNTRKSNDCVRFIREALDNVACYLKNVGSVYEDCREVHFFDELTSGPNVKGDDAMSVLYRLSTETLYARDEFYDIHCEIMDAYVKRTGKKHGYDLDGLDNPDYSAGFTLASSYLDNLLKLLEDIDDDINYLGVLSHDPTELTERLRLPKD